LIKKCEFSNQVRECQGNLASRRRGTGISEDLRAIPQEYLCTDVSQQISFAEIINHLNRG